MPLLPLLFKFFYFCELKLRLAAAVTDLNPLTGGKGRMEMKLSGREVGLCVDPEAQTTDLKSNSVPAGQLNMQKEKNIF